MRATTAVTPILWASVIATGCISQCWAGSSGPEWLYTRGNKIYNGDGTRFHGRGADLSDPNGCTACLVSYGYALSDTTNEVKRRLKVLVSTWGATFVRLPIETPPHKTQSAVYDAAYLAAIVDIVKYAHTLSPKLVVLVSLWIDPSTSPACTAVAEPTAATAKVWKTLAGALVSFPRVMFGVVNEPGNYAHSAAVDARIWSAMNSAVSAIRAVEAAHGSHKHIVAVQATRGAAAFPDYYLSHPITAGGGANVVYEVHVYAGASTFDQAFVTPSKKLPMIIGEFGYDSTNSFIQLTKASASQLMLKAEQLGIPYAAWAFHERCPPNLIVDNSGGTCGMGMAIVPTEFGTLLMNRLAKPYGQA